VDQNNVYNLLQHIYTTQKRNDKRVSFYLPLSLYLQHSLGKIVLDDSILLSDKCTVHIYWCKENGFFVGNYTLLHNVYCT